MNNSANLQQQPLMWWMILCAGIGGILYGYDVGVFSGAMPFIKTSIFSQDLSVTQINQLLGWLGGAVFAGSLVGTLITGYLSDRFGRRLMIMVASLIFFVGIGLILITHNFFELFLGRIVLGLGVGVVQVSVPAYLTEIAPATIRGKSVTVFQLFLTTGILLAYFVDLLFTPSGNWRAMFGMILIPSFILFISMLFLPESPRWLIANRRKERALKILQKIRRPGAAELELHEIIADLKTANKARWRDLFTKTLLLPLSLAIFVAIFNQLTAINGFLQYAPDVFNQAGIKSANSAMLGTVGLGTINLLGTLLAMYLIDKVGRRKLVITGTAGIVLSYTFLAITMNLALPITIQGLMAIIGLLFFVVFFAIGPGVVVWLAISELFPIQLRSRGIAVGLFASSLSAWLVTTVFLSIKQHLGLSGTYISFAACTLVYCLVCWKFLPETKGKSLEKVQEELQAKRQRS